MKIKALKLSEFAYYWLSLIDIDLIEYINLGLDPQ